jgi:hypothetical protein
MALAVAGASEATIAVVSGIIPGAILLGSSWWAVRRAELSPASSAAP